MNKKIGHSLEKLQKSLEKTPLITWYPSYVPDRRKVVTQTYTIECPHCKRFFEFNLEVKR